MFEGISCPSEAVNGLGLFALETLSRVSPYSSSWKKKENIIPEVLSNGTLPGMSEHTRRLLRTKYHDDSEQAFKLCVGLDDVNHTFFYHVPPSSGTSHVIKVASGVLC